MLKAHVCQTTENLAPKIHNLLRLAQLSRLPFSASQLEYLSGFDMYQLEGRYPDRLPEPLEKSDAINELKAVEKMLQWLTSQF